MKSHVEVESQAMGSHASDYHEADTITIKQEKKRDQNVHQAGMNDHKKEYNTKLVTNVRLQQWQVPHDNTTLT